MAALNIVLSILSTLVQLEPVAAEVFPIMEKVINGQTVTEAELARLESAATALNAQAEAGAKE